jgi:hypothetical protein
LPHPEDQAPCDRRAELCRQGPSDGRDHRDFVRVVWRKSVDPCDSLGNATLIVCCTSAILSGDEGITTMKS